MSSAISSPFEVLKPEALESRLGAEDKVLLVLDVDDGEAWLDLPQFGIEIRPEASGDFEQWTVDAMTQVLQRILSFYRALTELDEHYITSVETAQLGLIERVFLPWLGRTLAKTPQYVTVAEDEVAHLFDDHDHPVSA